MGTEQSSTATPTTTAPTTGTDESVAGPVTREPLRVGIVGYGLAGSIFHAPHIAAVDDMTLTHVVTSNADRGEQARREHPGVTVVPDLPSLLEHADDLDLVVVASPVPLHHEHARAVIETGTACLVDKPFVVDPADGHDLLGLADERRAPVVVFQNRRYDDDFLLVREVVRSGRLGEIYRFESRIERWKPVQRKAWKAEGTVAEGGGLLYDLGSHLLDQAIQLFGEPVETYAEINRRTAATSADDDTIVSLTHRGGVRSHLVMSTVTGIPGPRMTVVGSEGTLVIGGPDRQEECLDAGERPGDAGYAERRDDDRARLVIGTESGTQEAECPPMHTGGYVDFYRDLAGFLRGERPNPVPAQQSLAVVSLVRDLHERFPMR